MGLYYLIIPSEAPSILNKCIIVFYIVLFKLMFLFIDKTGFIISP